MLGLDNICKLRGEEMDMKQASVFLNNPKILATQGYKQAYNIIIQFNSLF